MQAGDLFATKYSVIVATLLIYALFAFLRAVSLLVTNRDKLRKIEAEVRAWEERKQKAIQSRDMKLYERVQREQARIDRLKREAEKERIKTMIVTFIAWPFLLASLWKITGDPPVALVPAPWGYERVTFSAWFIINTFWAGVLIDRLLSSLSAIGVRKRASR